MDNHYFEVLRHDINDPISVEVDEIYNLACPASPIYYQRDPVQTTKTSVMGAINVLDLAKRLDVKILQASTSEVYGDPELHPQPETYRGNVNPVGPRACYDEGKRCAETLFFDYKRQYDLDIKIIRIFNTYGPKMHPKDGRVVSNFIVQALNDDDITIYGNGTQTRCFCYVDDLVDGIINMMNKPRDFNGPVNLGNPEEYRILDLASKIMQLTNSNSELVYKPLPEDDPVKRKPDIDLAKKELGWEPKVSLEEGLKKTISYFKELLPGK
ncbi:UDP-glucuronic acid decarboxylase family protein [Methanosalsum zhilinae]|nr:UDP-glucuronic acid decarboxylase family protein [Methanosalsum zhilinae]